MLPHNDNKIHVMHLIGSTGLYGAERWILALMRSIDTDKVHSTLINLVDSPSESSQIVAAAKQRGLDAFDWFTGGRFNPVSALRLARWAKTRRVNIIHGHGFKSDVVGLLAARLARCKAVTTPHGWSLEGDRMLKLYEKLDRALYRYMDMVCPLSPDLANGLSQYDKNNNIRLIFNGVDLDEIRSIVPAVTSVSGFFTIGYIGQLIERKDLNTLLSAIKQLVVNNNKVRLVVIGDGPKHPALKDAAADLGIDESIEFMGFRPDAANYLKTFDVFVLPSLMEGIPRCIMEAMAAGVPVVASDIPGNRNLVIHGVTGLLFYPGDSQDLTEKILYLINQPEEAKAMAVRATVKVEEEFSSRKMAEEYKDIYFKLLES